MKSFITFDDIEAYLEHQLSVEAHQAMEERLVSDRELAQRVAHHITLHQGLERMARDQLIGEIAQLRAEAQHTARPLWERVQPYHALAAAALLLLLLGLGYGWLVHTHEPSYLFAQTYRPHALRATHMGAAPKEPTNPEQKDLTAFLESYEAQAYEKVIKLGETYLTQPSSRRSLAQDSLVQLGLANAYLMQDRTNDAINMLEGLSAKSLHQDEVARWYLILAHLKAGHSDRAMELLDLHLADTSSNYRQTQARKLLNKLQRPWH